MGNTNWKRHERSVARYFGTERNKRGNDFSVSDCDVFVPKHIWKDKAKEECSVEELKFYAHVGGVIVECKHGYSQKPVEYMREAHRGRTSNDKIALLIWGTYGISWLQDGNLRVFDHIWNDLIMHNIGTTSFLKKYHVAYVNRKTPDYIKNHMTQASDYCADVDTSLGIYVPLVALHARGLVGTAMVWDMFNEEST